jgi:hypothetical protein
VLGALPWLVSNLRHDWWSFSFAPGGGTYPGRFRGFFTATLPMAPDLRVPFTLEWALGTAVSGLALLAALACFALLALRRRRRLGPLLAVALAFPFLYAASSFTWLVEEPRYLVLLLPVLALLAAAPLRGPGAAALALAGALGLSVHGLVRIEDAPRYQTRTGHVDVPDDLSPLLRALEARGARTVVAEYWLAHRITFESREEIVATSSRVPEFTRVVEASADPAHAIVAGTADESRARPRLERRGYRRLEVGGIALYTR